MNAYLEYIKGVLQNSINLTTDASDILIVWRLRKIVPRWKVLLFVIPGMRTDYVTLPDVIGLYWAHWDVIMPSVPYTDKWGTAGERKHLAPHKLEIITRLWKVWKLKCGNILMQHWIISHIWYKETEGPIMIVYVINRKCEWPFESSDIERSSTSTVGQGVI